MIKKLELINTKTIKEEIDEIPANLKSKRIRSVSPPTFNKNNSNSNYHILKKIETELSTINPESLMLQVDPEIKPVETIEQIQFYYYNIKKEMNKYHVQEQKKKILTEKIDNLSKQIDIIIHPHASKISFGKDEGSENQKQKEGEDGKKKENKPIIDYRVKIRSLEKELEYTYQGYNSIKSKNNKLINQLDEMRKQNIFHMNKLNGLKKLLKEKDEKFKQDKKLVEENLKKKEEDLYLNKLIEKQNLLHKINKEMTDNIKETNIEITKKKAKKKYLDFQKQKLERKIETIENNHKLKKEKFNNEIKDELDKIKDFNEESEIIKCLDMKKMEELEKLLNNIFEETKTENSKQLIEYLTKSCEENLNFQNSVEVLQDEVNKLEKEVSELEYILSFCEENISVKKKNKLGENEINQIEKINNARDIFINLQYQVINELYKDYIQKFFDLMKQCNEMTEEHILKCDNINDIFGFLYKIQERLRNFSEKFKNNNINKDNKDNFNFNKWSNKWDRINKVKEGVIKDYMKKLGEGLNFDTNNIKSLVDEYLFKEKTNKEKKLIDLGNNK